MTTTTPAKKTATDDSKKSGIRRFQPGEVMFNEGDVAQSLFIIQNGQIRLYRPKGRGFVELAILRAGEVIGEMAYFDEKSRRRSCSAAAIVGTEVIEISFKAFEKTMAGLNPWFKTIINTLADRLRKTNEKVKALESNSVGFGAGGKVGDYVFFHNSDVIRILSTFYLVMKSHGEKNEDTSQWEIHMNKLKFYLFDVYNVAEVKFEEFMAILKNDGFVEIGNDEDGLPKVIKVSDVDNFRSMVVFFNSQRMAADEKKLKIGVKCQVFLKAILDFLTVQGITKPKAVADISAIMEEAKSKDIILAEEDLAEAVTAGLCEDIVVGEGNRLSSMVNYEKLKKIYPSVKMMNAVAIINESKSGGGKPKY